MWQKNVLYLDYNASSGLDDSVRERLIQFLNDPDGLTANPSSSHRAGQRQRRILTEALKRIAQSLGPGVTENDLVVTSSGTEANQTVLWSFSRSGFGIIVGAGEHSASYDVIPELKLAYPNLWIEECPISSDGTYDMNALANLLNRAAIQGVKQVGVSLFWVNNETGVMTDLDALRNCLASSPIKTSLHLDGAQVWGKMVFSVQETPASFVTFSSHKIGAPAGNGLIWKRGDTPLHPLLKGSQASGYRGGTENLLGIIGMRFACEVMNPEAFSNETLPLRIKLEEGLKKKFPRVKIWGDSVSRISNTTRFGFSEFSSGQNWVELLDLKGFAVSHGSACKSKVIEPSRLLLKMGATRAEALNSIRVSFGRATDPDAVERFLSALNEVYDQKGSTH